MVMVFSMAACATTESADDAAGGTSIGQAPATTAEVSTADDDASTTTTTSPRPTTTSTTSTTSTTTTTTSPTTTTTTTTLPAPPLVPGPLELDQPIVGVGWSVEGRPIFAERYGTVGGRRVLVIGVIHGDEDDGLAIVEELRGRAVPDGVELWIVESMNPDGVANQDRHNANDVDLNRNFPYNWGPIGEPGDGQYAGPGPASEPETQAMVNLMQQLQPDITLWYHQDLFVVNPAQGREGRVRARYAELTGLPMGQITGGTYTGIAATWARNEFRPADGVAFIVELGPTLSPEEATVHADAVLTIAAEG
jgi:protein MpaA